MSTSDHFEEKTVPSPSNQLEAIQKFYDLRGRLKLGSPLSTYGSQSLPLYLRAPYEFAEELIASYRLRCGEASPRLLDLGCGTGVHSIHPARLGYQVTGLDLSPASLEAAQQLAEANAVGSACRFVQGDAIEFLDQNRGFDIIFISGVLYYFDLAVILPRMKAALRPGGCLIAVETNGDNHLMNLARLRRRDRDERTKSCLLGRSDLASISSFLTVEKMQYFDFLTLAGAVLPLGHGRPASVFQSWASQVDRLVLNQRLLSSLAFKFVFQASSGGV